MPIKDGVGVWVNGIEMGHNESTHGTRRMLFDIIAF